MSRDNKCRVVIADDHAILREGLCALLSSETDIDIIGEAEDGKQVQELADTLQPDLILMDLSMPNTNGTEAIFNIKQHYPEIKIITLTVHKAEEYIHAALNAGADGYVLKDDSHVILLSAIRSVLNDIPYLSPSICDLVSTNEIGNSERTDNKTPSWEMLTIREREILKLIAEGNRNKEIADYLSLSNKTVEKHRSNLMKKLDLHSVSELTAYAINNKLTITK